MLIDQVRVLDARSIACSLGGLSGKELQKPDDALGLFFGLRT
jgi:hypothetical protein